MEKVQAGRFGYFSCVLLPQPHPGEREIRLRPPKERSMQRPREEMHSHV